MTCFLGIFVQACYESGETIRLSQAQMLYAGSWYLTIKGVEEIRAWRGVCVPSQWVSFLLPRSYCNGHVPLISPNKSLFRKYGLHNFQRPGYCLTKVPIWRLHLGVGSTCVFPWITDLKKQTPSASRSARRALQILIAAPTTAGFDVEVSKLTQNTHCTVYYIYILQNHYKICSTAQLPLRPCVKRPKAETMCWP